jgi:diketogulonate reductase-like aldo/keto reductase
MSSVHDIPAMSLSDERTLPAVGLGTWQLRGQQAYDVVRRALDAGYRHVDTATFYGNEAAVGRAVRDSGIPREDVFVTTKMWPDSAGHERAAITESLRLLGLDYVDLWLVHWPPGGKARPRMWNEFIDARDDGLARAIGVSNYSIGQLDELTDATGIRPAVNQIPWSPAQHDQALLAAHHDRGVTVVGYSPLKRTDLAGPILTSIAVAHHVTPAQVVLRWHIEHGIAVIPKSATPERILANIDLFGFTPSDDEISRVDSLAVA